MYVFLKYKKNKKKLKNGYFISLCVSVISQLVIRGGSIDFDDNFTIIIIIIIIYTSKYMILQAFIDSKTAF